LKLAHKYMYSDPIPPKDSDFDKWLKSFAAYIAANGASMGIKPAVMVIAGDPEVAGQLGENPDPFAIAQRPGGRYRRWAGVSRSN